MQHYSGDKDSELRSQEPYCKTKVLILDEATSVLDDNIERSGCLNLAAFKGKTVFFITYRLATIRNADVIVMMDAGTVAEEGTHQQLMAMQRRYYNKKQITIN